MLDVRLSLTGKTSKCRRLLPTSAMGREGAITVDFGVAGLGDVVVIHLKGTKGTHFTVTALPYGDKVEVVEGYQELKP